MNRVTKLKEVKRTSVEYVEIRFPLADWLKEHAEENGVTLQELAAHIFLAYREEHDISSDTEQEDDSEESEDGDN
jgi:hypothetical protein